VNGKAISGQKGTMLEGGSRVPMIASWPALHPSGAVNRDLLDFTDFFVTCAELAGAKLPAGVKLRRVTAFARSAQRTRRGTPAASGFMSS